MIKPVLFLRTWSAYAYYPSCLWLLFFGKQLKRSEKGKSNGKMGIFLLKSVLSVAKINKRGVVVKLVYT